MAVCRLYGATVAVSWRTKGGALHRSNKVVGWLTPRSAACPARTFDEQGFSQPTFNAPGNADSDVALSVTADHRTLFAGAELIGRPAGVARVQIDNVRLLAAGQSVESASLGVARSDTDGSDNLIVKAITRSFTPTVNCADYRVRVFYPTRLDDGTLHRYEFASDATSFCAR